MRSWFETVNKTQQKMNGSEPPKFWLFCLRWSQKLLKQGKKPLELGGQHLKQRSWQHLKFLELWNSPQAVVKPQRPGSQHRLSHEKHAQCDASAALGGDLEPQFSSQRPIHGTVKMLLENKLDLWIVDLEPWTVGSNFTDLWMSEKCLLGEDKHKPATIRFYLAFDRARFVVFAFFRWKKIQKGCPEIICSFKKRSCKAVNMIARYYIYSIY